MQIICQVIILYNQKFMLDRDLAELYQVKTKALKQVVKRNIVLFPPDFMFEPQQRVHSPLFAAGLVSESEIDQKSLRSKIPRPLCGGELQLSVEKFENRWSQFVTFLYIITIVKTELLNNLYFVIMEK